MTREEVTNMLRLLKVTYPAFYSKMKRNDLILIVDMWSEMFKDDDANIVKYALKELVATHNGYPPDIAALKNKIKEICLTASGEPTNEELWLMLKKAVSNGYYGAKEEFEKLPPVLTRYVAPPHTLTELACIASDTFDTVTHGQFLKQINAIKEREEYSKRMPEEVKALINSTYKPLVETTVNEEFNERRNNLLNSLEENKLMP